MDIKVKLDEDFSQAFEVLKEDFGEELARLNGFSDEQLSYTDFIDNFVDHAVVADASIDGNANVGHKDIVSLENEMSKPHSKLLAFNKIFHELKKKYGIQTATDWLENEWTGYFYLHDAITPLTSLTASLTISKNWLTVVCISLRHLTHNLRSIW